MWVSRAAYVGKVNHFYKPTQVFNFINTFAHSLKSLNKPLTWVYTGFPQITPLVTTTTYNYLNTPVRFPYLSFFKTQFTNRKTCKVLQVREG
jgi:hypothetical protein